MCRFVYFVRQERGESEEKWADQVAGRILELERRLWREREADEGGVGWRFVVDGGRSRRHSC